MGKIFRNLDLKARHLEVLKISVSFIVLFLLYHSAEYMLLFNNNIAGFFGFQFLFFITAWFFGNWNMNNGLTFWGLSFSKLKLKHFMIGIFLGLLLYAIPYLISLSIRVEFITNIPDWKDILKLSLPFAFGVMFSSFSEDVLTRATVFNLFNNKIKVIWIVLISSLVYLLNHIYRLNESFDTLSYIFFLGVLLIIPLILTKNLWITGFMHWSGNVFFYVTHNVIQTESATHFLTPNRIFLIWILILIPILYYLGSKYKEKLI
ncbi:CAAX protease self-immunity [Halpernia humi]|uniref:CAAX protease self-immunity n=1 Tax=Halpernia humi TaxID=493375 RepID=A0A1H6AYH5_9FLAO|nr:CPBP family intramembrane glutamic endopeptidase [Halpernia humi]SEG53648.1 CAAX protease self-immunity [Halpernia humi]